MKIRLKYRVFVAGMISLSLLSMRVSADDRHPTEQIQALVARGEILSVLDLQTRYPELLNDRWLDIELEREHGLWVYEFEVMNAEGWVTELMFNAETGELLEAEVDD